MRKLQACSLGSGFGLVRNGSRSQTVRAGTRVIGSGASAAMSSSSAPVIPHDKLLVEQTKTPRPKPANDSLVFGKAFSDHMCRVSWESQSNEWSRPVISEYKALEIAPGSPCLNYGIQCFEGMKAYKDANGHIRMFRPDMNMKRMNYSMQRLAMPTLDQDGLLECIKALVRTDGDWIPQDPGCSLYIRPLAIGTSAWLGVAAAEAVDIVTITSPVGPYFKEGLKPIRLYADTMNVRAWPNGCGNAKVGGNYGPTILPAKEAMQKHNCQQVLWLFGEDHRVTEVGAMNIFFVLRSKGDPKVREVVTAPLSSGDILPGVTRDSVLQLVKSGTHGDDLKVSERFLTMKEVVEAQREGRLLEVFGAGTAVSIMPVGSILYHDEIIQVPTGEGVGALTSALYQQLSDIQYGRVEHPWSVVV